jgi:surface protein
MEHGESHFISIRGAFGVCFLRSLAMFRPTTNMPPCLQFDGSSLADVNLTSWDTSNSTDMSYMFRATAFNGDISQWNTEKVTTMYKM